MSRSQQNADYLAQYNWMPYRNKLINGDFRIDQRFAGTSTTGSNYTPDRWKTLNTSGTITKQRVANGPFGNTYSLQMTVTSVGTRLSTDGFVIDQRIEADNSVDLQWGYSTAKTCTLSFWIKNSLTGTYGGTINSGNNLRAYGFTYTVNAASTWEYKTIVIPSDVTGSSTAYPSGNGVGLYVRFGFGNGANFSMTAGSWQALTDQSDVTGSASWAQTAGAVVNISMIQFEVGSVATPFENRPIGVELALCQRYYYRRIGTEWSGSVQVSTGTLMFADKLPMIVRGGSPAPSISLNSNITNANYINAAPTGTQWSLTTSNIGNATKTGTCALTPYISGDNSIGLIISGASWSISVASLNLGSGAGGYLYEVSAEL